MLKFHLLFYFDITIILLKEGVLNIVKKAVILMTISQCDEIKLTGLIFHELQKIKQCTLKKAMLMGLSFI